MPELDVAPVPVESQFDRDDALLRTDLWSCPFAVIDIETTGSVAGRDALTEIALVELCEGRIRARWRSFVNPLQRIPPFITQLTGITDSMVADAPAVGSLLPHVVDFVGNSILVGHNVRFDAAFLDFELRRHGFEGLRNPIVDTLVLARRTIAEVANYKLGTLTKELGIDVERHHRALADAAATAELLVHCIKKLEDCGVYTFGGLQEYLRRRTATRRAAHRARAFGDVKQLPVWTSILIAELPAVPCKPGVYLLKDAGDDVVYVGKSRNLRQRLRAYASAAKPAGSKVGALRAVVTSFDYLVTGSEFEALLLEAELVREYKPPFNERLRNFREFAFIKAEAGPYGRLVTTTRLAQDGGRYYGPYRSMAAAREAVAALQDALGLRGCEDPNDGESRVPPEQHEALLDEAIAFLQGEADEVLLTLARRRDEAIARLRVDVAAREFKRLDRLRRLRSQHAALEFATGLDVVVLAPCSDPAFESCFLLCGGRLVAQCRLPRRLPQRDEARALLAGVLNEKYRPEDVPRSFTRQEEIDQLYIFAAWYRERREGLSYIELPGRMPTPDEARSWANAILDGEPTVGLGEFSVSSG